jgi:hypothetical protein
MKIATSMLTVATVILWVVILFFSVTAVYSVMNVGVNIGEAQMLPTSNGIKFSLPFSISNEGYYEIADLNLTTRVTDPDGAVLDLTETLVESIPQGETVNASHTIAINLDDILSMDHLTLMLNDSNFTVEIFAGLSFARAVPVQISTNVSLPWGAPFADFAVGEPSVSQYNSSYAEVTIPVSFENHASIDITGTLKLEFYSNSNERIASGTTRINVAANQNFRYNILVSATPQDASKLTDSGKVHIFFETPLFTVDWWEQHG